jgi:hypothetical protein
MGARPNPTTRPARGGGISWACTRCQRLRRSFQQPLVYSARVLVPVLLAMVAGSCTSIGPSRLDRDQLDYTRALSESSKRQTLFNLLQIRYGNSPAFISVSQVLSSYSLQSTAQAGLNAFPSARTSDAANLLGSLQYTDRPTFTLTPITGEQFVQAYLRPFSPADIIPLIQGGVPVDVLFRLVAQSVGPLQNTHPLGSSNRSGSPAFLRALEDLRILQEAGVLRVHLRRERQGARIFIAFETRHVPTLRGLVSRVAGQLAIDPSAHEVEVIYGPDRGATRAREIPVLTRSLLDVLSAVAAEVQVPDEDVRDGRTNMTLQGPDNFRPCIVIQSGPAQPQTSYAAVRVSDRWYWISDTDFQSKIAFSLLEILKSIAEGTRSTALPVLTIPAG